MQQTHIQKFSFAIQLTSIFCSLAKFHLRLPRNHEAVDFDQDGAVVALSEMVEVLLFEWISTIHNET